MFKDFESKYNQIYGKDHLRKSTKHSNKFYNASTNCGHSNDWYKNVSGYLFHNFIIELILLWLFQWKTQKKPSWR